MGLFDNMKEKASDLAEEHGDTADDAIDKAADFADEKTGGKHTEKIEGAAEKAKGLVDGLADADDE